MAQRFQCDITTYGTIRPSAFHQWVARIQQGTSATENIQIALDLTCLIEAANRWAHGGQTVRLDSLAGA